jgi:non-homologous end joining protein Ku
MLKIQLGLLGIPIQTINFSNSRYATSGLHQFSICCKEAVGNKNYCKGCGKEVNKEEILKGIDKNTILNETQQEALKTALEGGLMEVLGIKDINETTTYDILPFVIKSQLVLPSISKGYKKVDIKTFYSFKIALKELNKFCIVKLTQRNTEHIGILLNWRNDLIWLELPFKHYSNIKDLDNQKELVDKVIQTEKIMDLESFKEQAQNFINSYKSKVNETDEIEENKKMLLNTLVKEIRTGVIKEEIKINEKNPFA